MNIQIQSSANAVFKHVKKLGTKSGRTKAGQYIAEGVRAVADAVANDADIEYIILCDGAPEINIKKDIKTYTMSATLFDKLKLTVNSQGVLAVINYRLESADALDAGHMDTIVYLDTIQDPGNLGTIIRTSDAFGADAIILSKGCADLFNPKVVRSTMASLFNVPIFSDSDPHTTLTRLLGEGFSVVGTFPKDGQVIYKEDYTGKNVIVMGNEANGISEQLEALCTKRVTIPMSGRAESLNVATAFAVVLYEVKKNKR